MAEYGEKLKQIRQKLLLTQDEFAGALEMKSRAYAAYERNENKPPLFMLEMLCNDYDVNLNWLISGKGDMFNRKQPANLKDEIKQAVREMLKDGELTRDDFE